MIIDNWLYRRNINHERNVPYLNTRMTADFRVGEYIIEFLGLKGQLERYDYLVSLKEKLWKDQHLQVIKLYPKDIFPKSRLSDILQVLIK